MILSNKNDLLFDSKNFDKYRNIYTIKINANKIENLENNLKDCDDKLYSEYDAYYFNLKLFFTIEQYFNLTGIYKIIFGHYYNNQNAFLYKGIHNKKIITTSIHHCKHNELLFNNAHDLIYGNSYDTLQREINIITENKKNEMRTLYYPLELSYKDENLTINTKGNLITSYSNECLEISNL